MGSDLSVHELRLRYTSIAIFNFGAGIALMLVLTSIFVLLSLKRQGKRIHNPTLIFLFVSLVVNMSYFGFVNKTQEVALIESKGAMENDLFPGTHVCSERAVMSYLLSTASILLNDMFFIYRAYILFGPHRWFLVIPAFLYTCLIVTGAISVTRCLHDTVPDYIKSVSITFDGVTIGLNAILASMVSLKLVSARRSARKLGPHMNAVSSKYTTTIGLIIESALAWTIVGFAFLIAHLLDSDAVIVLRGIFEITGGLSPAISIFRIVFKVHYVEEPPYQVRPGPPSQQRPDDTHLVVLRIKPEPEMGKSLNIA